MFSETVYLMLINRQFILVYGLSTNLISDIREDLSYHMRYEYDNNIQ